MSLIDEYIEEGERFLSGEEGGSAKALVKLFCGAIADDVPTYKHGLALYRATVNGMPAYTDGDARRDVEVLVAKMRALRDRREHELEVAKLNAAARGATVILSDVGNSRSEASAVVSVTISQVSEAVDAEPGLTDAQKSELQELLAQAKGAAARGDRGLFSRIGSKLMEGVEKATPGLIVKVLEFLLGLATGGL